MDRERFDALTQACGSSRRGILRALLGGVGVATLGITRGVAGGDARKRRTGKRRARLASERDLASGTAGAAVDQFVRCALAQIGKPYIWATAGPDTFDCSGLVAYCYQEATGQVITRSSHAQFEFGSLVSANRGHLEPGDLVFYDIVGDGAGHVGIVVGPDRAVHALNPGMGVRVTGIHGAELGGPYLGARRLDFLDAEFRDASSGQGPRRPGRAGTRRTQERRKRKSGKRDARERRQEREATNQLEAPSDVPADANATADAAQAYHQSPGYDCMNDPFLLVRQHDGVGCTERNPALAPETDEDPLDG